MADVSISRLNRQSRKTVDRALDYEDELAALYAAQIRKAAKLAAARFIDKARVRAVVSDAAEKPPNWSPPDPDELMLAPLDEKAEAKVKAIWQAAANAAIPAITAAELYRLGIALDISSPFASKFFSKTAGRINIEKSIRDALQKTIGEAYTAGWSVPRTSDAIYSSVEHLTRTTAVMQARTDLVGIANGASLASVAALGTDGPPVKIWLATEDERTRETHAEADGQEVPLDQPFQVGDDLLMYPGDPDGSDAEVCNCRCTIIYGDGAGVADEELAVAASAGASADGSAGVASSGMEPLEFVAGAVGYQDFPLSDRDVAWDGGAATKAWQNECGIGGDNPNWTKFRQGFLWYDSGNPELVGSYKLPYVDVIGGTPTAVWRGITAAAGRLSQTQIPAADKDRVRATLTRWYSKAQKQYDDPSIEAPFAAIVAAVTITIDDEDGEMAEGYDDGEMGGMAETAWQGILCVEGTQTEDGRLLAAGALSWRDCPLSLGVLFDTPHSYGDASPVCGRIDAIWRDGSNIMARGIINADEIGCRVAELVGNLSLRGISVDLMVRGYRLEPAVPPVGTNDVPDDGDGDEDRAEQIVEADNMIFVVTDGVIGGATLCPVQAVAAAKISLVASNGGVWLAEESLVASAMAPTSPPLDWFTTAEPPGLMPLTVTDDGRVFGHLAAWNSCHTGFSDVCTRAPRSASSYAYFHVGELDTADGKRVSVGKLMVAKTGRSGKHAPLDVSRLEAAKHYDDNTAVGAYIRVIDGKHGPWAAGVIRPGLEPEGIAQLKANPPSGDWRRVNGSLELIAALAVPVPGFPVPRTETHLVASADEVEVDALIASSGTLAVDASARLALERAGILPRAEEATPERIEAVAARALGRDAMIAAALGD